jgi:hypothetical protein
MIFPFQMITDPEGYKTDGSGVKYFNVATSAKPTHSPHQVLHLICAPQYAYAVNVWPYFIHFYEGVNYIILKLVVFLYYDKLCYFIHPFLSLHRTGTPVPGLRL